MGWSRFGRRDFWDKERACEIESYLENEIADNLARGMTAEDARHAARRKLGNPTIIREEIYRMNTLAVIETFWRDLILSVRMLKKSPGFTVIAIMSLALGIGANTAVFSVVRAVIIRALPYPNPERLVRVAQRVPLGAACTIQEFEFWKEHSKAFAFIAGHRVVTERNLVSPGMQQWIKVLPVTTDFFRTIGITPSLGREFNAEEARMGGPQAIILTNGLWRRSFDGDPRILGRTIALDDTSFIVAGVLPKDFWSPQALDAFVPLRRSGALADTGTNTQVIARLQPGISLRRAQAEMESLTESYRVAYAGRISRDYRGLMVRSYQEWLVGDVRLNLLFLFGAVALLLLIACSNLASLLLARLAARHKETAVRLALGCSRRRLLGQFLVENILLSLLGSLAGLIGASWLLKGLLALLPFDLPTFAPIRMDVLVMAFTVLIAVSTGLVFSLIPFLTSRRLNLYEALRASGRSTGSGPARQRVRRFLVVGEVALSVTLLVVAGLLIRTLYRMHQERLGFTPESLITFQTPLSSDKHRNGADLLNYEESMLARLQALPGIRRIAAINVLPLTGIYNLPTQREGHAEQSIGGMEVRWVTRAYFEAMVIPIRAGRGFTDSDTRTGLPVALVNETLARNWWPDGKAVGGRLVVGRSQDRDFPEFKDFPREVVGIVANTKTLFLKEPPRPTVYIPATQVSDGIARTTGTIAWVLTATLSTALAEELRRAVLGMDPGQRVANLKPMEQMVASTTAGSRFDAWLFGIFAAVALVLTAIGVYGLLAFSVEQRRQEIGTRMALGASRADILALVLKQGFVLTSAGLVLGLAGALVLTRYLGNMLYGVHPFDPLSFGAVSVLLLVVGFLSSYLPARRATNVDPLVALRHE